MRTNTDEWQKRRTKEEKQREKLNAVRTLAISGNRNDVLAILENLKTKYGDVTVKEVLDDWHTDKLELC